VEKLQPQATDDQAKGKAPAKGKPAAAAAGEESKPVKGEAWLDLTPFMYPGCTESLQRIFVNTCPEPKEEGEEVKSG
jgi:hypothetical protein